MAEGPITFQGYDSDNNEIANCTATDANTYIDPAQVKAAIEKINKVAEEGLKKVSDSLRNVEPEAGDAIVVKGTNMSESIEEVCNLITGIPKSISGNIGSMYEAAVAAHDKIQLQLNQDAYDTVKGTADVVTVSPNRP